MNIPSEFRSFLLSDNIVLPDIPHGLKLKPTDPRRISSAHEDSYEAFGDVNWDSDGSEAEKPMVQEVVENWLNTCIEELGGEVFVKLSWTSPRDASFMNSGLKCRSSGEVLLLLKSSDLVQHDLQHAFRNCMYNGSEIYDVCLATRKWANLDPAMEFRCFVINNKLVAVAQRDAGVYYDYLSEGKVGKECFELIQAFTLQKRITERFPSKNFVYDVFVDRNRRVWIVDFGVLPEILQEPLDDGSFLKCSERLVCIPPHELISWEVLSSLQQPIFFTVNSRGEEKTHDAALVSHRFPIELSTGELTPDIFRNLEKL